MINNYESFKMYMKMWKDESIKAREIRIQKLDERAITPTRGSPESAGLDLYSIKDYIIMPGFHALVDTGLAIAVPKGFQGQICPRSGLSAKNMVTVLNGPGILDSDFRGHLRIILINHGSHTYNVKAGDRVAQLVVNKVILTNPVVVENLEDTTRGQGGLGSTGK